MNYATGCAFNLDEIFMNFDKSKLKMTSALCSDINKNPHKIALIKKIFRVALKIIINDIIDNNITFTLPTGGRKSEIMMSRISGEQFSKARQNGKFMDIDFIESNFSGYELKFIMYRPDGAPTRTKTIYVDNKLKAKITQKTNQGMQYY